MTRIVVTGFEPWQHGAENPTLAILDGLEQSNALPGELTTLRLPVDTHRIADMVAETLDRVRPDLWISLGLAPGSSVMAIERIAANVRDFSSPDNEGNQPIDQPVYPGGPAGRLSTLPIKAIARAMRDSGIPAKISNSPATYLCNQMMYTVLHLIEARSMPTRAGFIHVPASPAHVARQVYPFVEMPSMSVDLMTRAVECAVRASVSNERDEVLATFND